MGGLSKVFKALRKDGLLARQKFLCCQSCAGVELADEVRVMMIEGKAAPVGVVYSTRQSQNEDRAVLYFGPLEVEGKTVGKPTEEVGRMVCQRLGEMGVSYEWDGNGDHTIVVNLGEAA